MENLDYKNLSVVIVHNQKEMDSIPDDFRGRIRLQETTEQVYIKKKYALNVYVEDKASAVAYDNASVEARGNASVEARGNASVVAYDNASVEARGNASVVARGNASVVAYDNASVEARGNASVVAYDNASVEARGNASVVAYDNASVEARGNVQVVDRTCEHKIEVSANARIVYMPHGLQEFINFFGIKVQDGVGTFYKAVRKSVEDGQYHSNYDYSFIYEIGKEQEEPCINRDTSDSCGDGIHISTMQFALDFGKNWKNLAILECQSKLEDIVCPDDTEGKVRTSKVMVVREVPLEECGVYGKILAKKLKRNKI